MTVATDSGLDRFTGLYIAGDWLDGGGSLPVIDPTTGRVVRTIATASTADCVRAVDAAGNAASAWSAAPLRQRAEVLRRCYELMVAERSTIAQLIQLENGKAVREADAEVGYAAEFFRWFSEETPRIGGELRAAPTGDKQIMVVPEPVGVCVLVTPWNFPAAMATRKLAPALGAGCTCVLKPAPETPLTALYLVDLLERAGVPPGVVNVVVPEPPADAVRAMLGHTAVRKLSFTGSTAVGRELLTVAGENVLRSSMELGGNAPFLVLEDGDVETAVTAAVLAKMRNGGASCIAANRFLVHRRVHDEFVERFVQQLSLTKIGLDREADADLGALVSEAEVDKVGSVVEAFNGCAGSVVLGGARVESGGFFYPPTVVTDVPADSPTLATEIFGPVAPVAVIESDEEAIVEANRTESGLIAYVMSRDVQRAIRVGRHLEAGMVAINRGLISDPAAPFGGFKQSGLGKEGGREGIDEYLRHKYLGVDL